MVGRTGRPGASGDDGSSVNGRGSFGGARFQGRMEDSATKGQVLRRPGGKNKKWKPPVKLPEGRAGVYIRSGLVFIWGKKKRRSGSGRRKKARPI